MHKYITGPIVIGVLAFLFTLFILPMIVSESTIVSMVATSALSISNILFAVMPPMIVDFIGNLNLTIAALSLGLTLTIAFQSVALLQECLAYLIRLIIALRQKSGPEPAQDLPPIEMDMQYRQTKKDKIVYGKGFDPIDHDRQPTKD